MRNAKKKTIWFTETQFQEVLNAIRDLGEGLKKIDLSLERGQATMWVKEVELLEPFSQFNDRQGGCQKDRTLRVKVKVDGRPEDIRKVHMALLSEYSKGVMSISYEEDVYLTVRFKSAELKKAFTDFVRGNYFCNCRVLS